MVCTLLGSLGAVLGLLCAAGARAPVAGAPAGGAVALERSGAQIIVRSPLYRIAISPAEGGRIVSFVWAGRELTRVSANGHGGLFEEVHTADAPFEVAQMRTGVDEAVVTLQAETRSMSVEKTFRFRADRPWFTVELAFENRSRYVLGGSDAPAVRNLAAPADGAELFCMDRGAGAEALSAGLFRADPGGRPGPLRWIAVCDPTARRALGFALLNGPCRLLPPSLVPEGGLLTGWSLPPIRPGERRRLSVLVVPLSRLTALAELNALFACDSTPEPAAAPPATRFRFIPLRDDVRDVSVITRVYDAAGRELGSCDPLLIQDAPAFQGRDGRVVWRGEGAPAWFVHEVYSRGRRAGNFAVPLGRPSGPPPVASPAPEPLAPEPPHGRPPPAPGATIPVGPAQAERGFVIWPFDGVPPRAEMDRLEFHLARGQTRTAFVGLRALRPLEDLRVTLAGTPGPGADAQAVPAGAVSVWQVLGEEDGRDQMVPLSALDLGTGETAWLAVSADATGLPPGAYVARLTVSTDGVVFQVPLTLKVFAVDPPKDRDFGLWYVPGRGEAPLPAAALAKLRTYRTGGLTAPLPPAGSATAVAEAARQAERHGLRFLSLRAGRGAHSPPRTDRLGLLLPCPRPLWLVDAGAASPGALRGAREAQMHGALLCEGLGTLRTELLGEDAGCDFLLVRDGCEPGKVPEMVSAGLLRGDESVWLYLDLRSADWRRAATEVRSALWAAAWQGLAGVAVCAPVPFPDLDRHSPLWQVIRDARQEVALWRQARRLARGAAPGGEGRADVLRKLAVIEGLVGTAEGCALRLRPERRPFRSLLRVAPSPQGRGPAVSRFAAVHDQLLALAGGLEPGRSGPATEGRLYWDGMPLVEDGRVQWAIVAADGEQVWKQAMALQRAIEGATGRKVPVSRAFPAGAQGDLPQLVWVLGDATGRRDWPESVRAAAEGRLSAPLAVAELPGGTVAVLVAEDVDAAALLRTFLPGPDLYPTALHVK